MLTSASDDFAAIVHGHLGVEQQPAEPPQPRVPLPNPAQGTSSRGMPVETAAEHSVRAFAARFQEVLSQPRNPGGWVDL